MNLKRHVQNDTRDRLEAAYTLRLSADEGEKAQVRKERKRLQYRLWKMKNREHRNAYMREYNKTHKEAVKAYAKRWYEKHREEHLERMKRYNRLHKEELKASMKRWYEKRKKERELATSDERLNSD